jgi:hypothetical protein
MGLTSTKQDYPSEEAFISAANRIGCRVEMIKAFAEVESGKNGAFLDTGEPVILFERHKFHKFTKGRYDGSRIGNADSKLTEDQRDISSPKAGGYGPVSIQHRKLHLAINLDRESALKSCSWGLFQLMGFNYALCGFATLQSFINAMYENVDRHLEGFVSFILTNPKRVKGKNLRQALIDEDCEIAAEIYNGSGYAKNKYDVKLRGALVQLD